MHWVLGTDELWWLALAGCLLLALPALPLLASLPDTPAYLIAKQQDYGDDAYEARARDALRYYQGSEARFDAHKADASYLQTKGKGCFLSNHPAKARNLGHNLGSSMWTILSNEELRAQLYLALAVMSLYFPASLFGYSSTFAMAQVTFPTPARGRAGLLDVCKGGLVGVGERADNAGPQSPCAGRAAALHVHGGLHAPLPAPRQRPRHPRLHARPRRLSGTRPARGLPTDSPSRVTGSLSQGGGYSWCFATSLFVLQASVNFGIRQLYWVIVPELFPCR